jgi:hypothetical protein
MSEDSLATLTAAEWNYLCWYGSLYDFQAHRERIMDACSNAVTLSDSSAYILDSRGLARALAGDYAGAIEDFQPFISAGSFSEEDKERRRRWIEILERGENPFTPEELKELREE